MGITVGHSKTITIADGTGTATNLVMPSDWNSAHTVSLSLAGGEVIKFIQAGTTSVSSGTVSFADGGGMTFGMATNGIITGSVKTDYLTTAMQSGEPHVQQIVAGTGTLSGSLVLSGSGGISVSNNGQSIIVSFDGHHLDGLIPSGNGNGTGFSSMTSGTVGINAAGAISMSQNANNLTISAPAQTVQPVAYAVGGTTNNFSTLAFANSNGLSWSTGTQGVFPGTAVLTTAAQSAHSHALATTTTNGSLIVVATSNSAGATIAVPPFITTAQAPGAYLTTAAQSDHSHGNPTLALTNITGTTASNSAGLTLSLSAGAGGTINQTGPNIAVGGTTLTSGTILFANTGNVTFGLNGSTITASAPGGGGGATLSRWMGPAGGMSSITSHAASAINGSILIGYEQIPVNVSATKVGVVLGHSVVSSYNVSQVGSLTMDVAIYGRMNSSAISLMSSGNNSYSMSWSSSTTTGVMGMRELYVPFNVNLTPGVYYVARRMSYTGNNASAATAHTVSQFGVPMMTAISAAADGYTGATAASNAALIPFHGVFSTTSGAFPATIGLTDITHTGTALAAANYWKEFAG